MNTATGQLAWAEGRRLVRNPVIWLSLVPAGLWLRAANGAGGRRGSHCSCSIGFGLLIPGFMMLVVTVLAVLRRRLEHTEPLLATLAVGTGPALDRARLVGAGGWRDRRRSMIAAAAVTLPAPRPTRRLDGGRCVRSSCRDPTRPDAPGSAVRRDGAGVRGRSRALGPHLARVRPPGVRC